MTDGQTLALGWAVVLLLLAIAALGHLDRLPAWLWRYARRVWRWTPFDKRKVIGCFVVALVNLAILVIAVLAVKGLVDWLT